MPPKRGRVRVQTPSRSLKRSGSALGGPKDASGECGSGSELEPQAKRAKCSGKPQVSPAAPRHAQKTGGGRASGGGKDRDAADAHPEFVMKFLRRAKLDAAVTKRDGNCYFHSLLAHPHFAGYRGKRYGHCSLRKDVLDRAYWRARGVPMVYVETLQDGMDNLHPRKIPGNGFNYWLRKCRENKAWADHGVLALTALVYRVRIVVLQVREEQPLTPRVVIFDPPAPLRDSHACSEAGAEAPTVYLLHEVEYHYSPVVTDGAVVAAWLKRFRGTRTDATDW